MISSIGIVGHGAFGSLLETLAHRFVPTVQVRVYSSRHEPDGSRFFSLADTAQSDALILAVPIAAFEDTLVKVMPLTREDTIIVDVATVKMHTVQILKRHAAGRQYIATHPMWGPESYQKKGQDVTGFRIVLTDTTLAAAHKEALASFLRDLGFDVVEMTAESHDKHLAETLFLTHFIGQVVSKGRFNRTEIDTVSFGYLMDAVESVSRDTQLFKDVYHFNPYCEEVLRRFEVSEKEVQRMLSK